MLKKPFLGVLGQKGRFWTIFGQKGTIFEFSVKKRKGHFFTYFFHFSIQKNQKILMRGFSGKYERTDVRTNGGESKGPTNLSRDQKEIKIFDDQNSRIWVKFGRKWAIF